MNTKLWIIARKPDYPRENLLDRLNYDNGAYVIDAFNSREEGEEFLLEGTGTDADGALVVEVTLTVRESA